MAFKWCKNNIQLLMFKIASWVTKPHFVYDAVKDCSITCGVTNVKLNRGNRMPFVIHKSYINMYMYVPFAHGWRLVVCCYDYFLWQEWPVWSMSSNIYNYHVIWDSTCLSPICQMVEHSAWIRRLVVRSPLGCDIFCLKKLDTFSKTSVHESKMNVVACAHLTL